MTGQQINKALQNIIYKDGTDIIELRWLLLHGMHYYASAYKESIHQPHALKLLQQHKTLQAAHTLIKEKSRNHTAGKDDFINARNIALHCMLQFGEIETLSVAA